MKITYYLRGEDGIITGPHVELGWDSEQQFLEECMRADEKAHIDGLVGWPHTEVEWHRDVGLVRKTEPRKYPFIEYIGHSWFNGKGVAVYRIDDNTVQLRAKTAGGKMITRAVNVSNEELERRKEEWSKGVPDGHDFSIAKRALEFMSQRGGDFYE